MMKRLAGRSTSSRCRTTADMRRSRNGGLCLISDEDASAMCLAGLITTNLEDVRKHDKRLENRKPVVP